MKKIIYYLRIILFVLYLITMFLLIDKLYKTSFLSIIYYIFIIISIITKKKIFKNIISYNLLNIGIYLYTFMLYKIIKDNSFLDIINNKVYFNNNYIMMSILLFGLTTYTLILNNEKNWYYLPVFFLSSNNLLW